jgi:hypothetical protein
MAKPILVPLAQISNKFDVRTSLDQDRVIYLAELYEGGVDVAPVKLLKLDNTDPVEYAYVDGRHRGAARDFLGMTDIPAIFVDSALNNQPSELYALALEANYGGAKPPTRDDIVHTIQRMLEAGVARTTVAERLSFIPKGALRAFLSHAQSTISKRRMVNALDMVAKGKAIEEAAKESLVRPDALKEAINGKKGKWGKNRSEEIAYSVEVKGHISRVLRSANTSISIKMSEVAKRLNEGDMSPETARDIVRAWLDHLRKTTSRVRDWSDRIDSLAREHTKSTKSA